MFSYGAHFDQKVGTYIVAKLSQFASLKEPYVILAGPDSLIFWPFLCHRIMDPHTGIFSIVLQ